MPSGARDDIVGQLSIDDNPDESLESSLPGPYLSRTTGAKIRMENSTLFK